MTEFKVGDRVRVYGWFGGKEYAAYEHHTPCTLRECVEFIEVKK